MRRSDKITGCIRSIDLIDSFSELFSHLFRHSRLLTTVYLHRYSFFKMPIDRKTLPSLCVFLLIIVVVNGDLLKLTNGLINGTEGKTKNGRAFKRFYSIPYAEPPVGELRFKAPVAIKSWSGIKDASKPPSKCIQPKQLFDPNSGVDGNEDCLYLNVFVPNELFNASGTAPVIVGIHGGAFSFGQGLEYTPDYFMEKDVIFVNLNYRLGVLGFFGMNNDVISGNFGMKDQSLALRWVKENIAQFGGDPQNVTLLGESAGAASVHLHMFSPLSKGLFQKAIMQSGSAFAPWSHHDDGFGEAMATAFLVISGCFRKDPEKILKCLQRIPFQEFNALGNKFYMWESEPGLAFKPMIESNVKTTPFLSQKPANNTYQTNVPWITGINSGEGAMKVMSYFKKESSLLKIINSNKKRILPLINDYVYVAEPENVDNTTQKIIDFYFGTKDIGSDTALKLVDMVTDSTFLYPMIKAIQSSHREQYVYLYDHQGSFSYQDLFHLTMNLGVSHADELNLLFREETKETKWTPQDKKVSENLLKLWINFVITGDPNGNSGEKLWKPVQTEDIEYLHIKSDSLFMEQKFLKERFDFWESLSLRKKYV